MTVLLLGPVSQAGLPVLQEKLAESVEFETAMPDDPYDELSAKFAAADVIVCPAFRKEFPPAPKLKMLHAPNAGLDSIEFDILPHGVRVCNVFEHDVGIGEYVLLAMLNRVLNLDRLDRAFRKGSWADSPRTGATPRSELSGQTLLCVGYGSIGRGVAARAQAFGVQIDAVTKTPRSFDPMPRRVEGFDRLRDLIPDADFVLIACPLTEETEGLIDQTIISSMKPTAVLINVGRGAIVNQTALYSALAEGRIGGAVLDTWYRYPNLDDGDARPADLPFWELDNVTMTPHCSAWTGGLIDRRFTVVAENIRRVLRDESLINQVFP